MIDIVITKEILLVLLKFVLSIISSFWIWRIIHNYYYSI